MVLTAYDPKPLARCYGALLGMMERAIKLGAVPAGFALFEKMPEDFWVR